MSNSEKGSGAGMRLLRRTISVAWKLAILAVVAAFVVYRLRFAPIPVESYLVTTGPIVVEVMGTGTLEARVQATISPKISGLIIQVLADQGDRITKGQLLATLDDGDLRQQVEMAKAELAATKAGVDVAAAGIVSAEATALQTRTAYARYAKLIGTSAISDADLETATQQRDVAEATLHRAQLAKVEIERQVVKAEATLRYNQELLAYTRITSPFDGLVIRRSREPGDIAVPGSEILQIISTDQMWVSAWVDETAMAALAVNQPARIAFRSDPYKSYNGTVTRLAPSADRETREFLVDVTVKDLPKTWAVGQRADVYIRTAEKDQVLLVPSEAITWQNGKPGLFVNAEGHAKWRSIALGLRGTQSVEVTQGLAAGETVVWLHDPKAGSLTEGRKVSLVTP
jgi:HlyD family secretion protein